MKQNWLNLVLHLTSRIQKQKQEIIISGVVKTTFLAIYIILLELVLLIVSVPTYFFIKPDSIKGEKSHDKAATSYKLRRKITISAIIVVLGLWLINILTALLLGVVVAPDTAM